MSVKFFPTNKRVCDCEADIVEMSSVIAAVRGNPWHGEWRKKRSQQVRHYRERDDAYFWHWRDTTVTEVT